MDRCVPVSLVSTPPSTAMTKPSLGARTLISVSERVLPLCIAMMAVCSACRYDPFYYMYLKDAPPKDRICGIWVIDPDRTTWRDAKPLLARGEIGPQHGYLEITADGRFVIENLPDFSFGCFGPIVPHQSGSGTWWTAFDQMNEWSYLWLHFEKVDGKSVEDKTASVHFRREGDDYFLHVIIIDPDTGDALVMRKTDKPAE